MRGLSLLAAIAWLVLAASIALGQSRDVPRSRGTSIQFPLGRPALTPILLDDPGATMLSQRPLPPISTAQLARVNAAQTLRESGLVNRARDTLLAVLRQVPHHPIVLTELGRVYVAKQDFAALEQLARAERQAQHDSLLLGRDSTLALERLGRPSEAGEVALEMWAASVDQAEWANPTLVRLSGADPRGIREAMERTVQRLPARLDLVRGLARLQWRLGDTKATLRTLDAAEQPGRALPMRWSFADELLRNGNSRDSTGAVEAFVDIAGDMSRDAVYRVTAARRAWEVYRARLAERQGAPRIRQALKDLPTQKWQPELLVGVARGLREAGMTAEARELLGSGGAAVSLPPEVAVEQALNELRDGPPGRALPALRAAADASPEGTYRYAEALFFAGEVDSALVWYKKASEDPKGPFTGAALERIYLLEDSDPRSALPVFGRIAYEDWRGDLKQATALCDSLYHALPRGASWAQSAIWLSGKLEAAGDAREALEPLLAVADSLPNDRLAPLARQKAGDIYLNRLKDEKSALAQYEECVARYPKAWNAPEVRRKLETLRRERRF